MLCYEIPSSRRFTAHPASPSGQIGWVVNGAGPDDSLVVRNAVLLEAPSTYGGLLLERIEAEHVGGLLWHATTFYGLVERETGADGGGAQSGGAPPAETPPPPEDDEPLGAEWSWTSKGDTVHITQSKRTRSRTARPGATAPNYQGAIGVSKDGVAGCDVFVGKFEWSLTRHYKQGVTRKYLRKLSELTGTTSAGAFFGWSAEEVLFLGADGNGGENKAASVTYTFAAKPSRTNVAVGASTANTSMTASRTSGSPNLTVGSTTGITAGMVASGTGIPAGTTVATVTPPTTVVLSANATSTGSDSVTFSDGAFTIPFVGGWDHVWIAYGPSTHANQIVQIPIAAYVEQVYDVTNFDALGLGG